MSLAIIRCDGCFGQMNEALTSVTRLPRWHLSQGRMSYLADMKDSDRTAMDVMVILVPSRKIRAFEYDIYHY